VVSIITSRPIHASGILSSESEAPGLSLSITASSSARFASAPVGYLRRRLPSSRHAFRRSGARRTSEYPVRPKFVEQPSRRSSQEATPAGMTSALGGPWRTISPERCRRVVLGVGDVGTRRGALALRIRTLYLGVLRPPVSVLRRSVCEGFEPRAHGAGDGPRAFEGRQVAAVLDLVQARTQDTVG
jgi:hypothetical protein